MPKSQSSDLVKERTAQKGRWVCLQAWKRTPPGRNCRSAMSRADLFEAGLRTHLSANGALTMKPGASHWPTLINCGFLDGGILSALSGAATDFTPFPSEWWQLPLSAKWSVESRRRPRLAPGERATLLALSLGDP